MWMAVHHVSPPPPPPPLYHCQITFDVNSGISLAAAYRTSIYVANASLGDPLIVQLDADLAVTGERMEWAESCPV